MTSQALGAEVAPARLAPARNFIASVWSSALWVGFCLLTNPQNAAATPNGAPTPSCNGCHAGDGVFDGQVELTPSGDLVPGEAMDFTLDIRENDLQVAGFYLTTLGVGEFGSGSGVRSTDGAVTHSRPMAGTDGSAQVSFSWTPPDEPGGTDFLVYVLSANDDRESSGDRFASVVFSYAWGCDGIALYRDIDGDGYGEEAIRSIGCEVIDGWADTPGDCVDTQDSIYPGAPEKANGKDDDCNGEIDEGIEYTLMYPDEDADGFGSALSVGIEATTNLQGYSTNSGDCDDVNVDVNPDALEICDGFDNDCNGQVDEGEGNFERCGVGACSRVLEVCDRACVPGTQGVEVCNGLDDDCDGETDEGDLCAAGEACVDFACRPLSALSDASAQASMVDSGSVDGESQNNTPTSGSSTSTDAATTSDVEPGGGDAEDDTGSNASGDTSTSSKGSAGAESGAQEVEDNSAAGAASEASENSDAELPGRASGSSGETSEPASGGSAAAADSAATSGEKGACTVALARSARGQYWLGLVLLSLIAARRRARPRC